MYGDRVTLGAAHALEQLFASDPALRRPVPSLEAARATARAGGARG
jgi:hypothetical protein